MIAVVGPPGDPTTAVLRRALESRQAAFRFINQAEVLSQAMTLEVDDEVGGNLRLGAETIDLRDFTAAFLRPHDSAEAPAVAVHGALSIQAFHARQVDALLARWADVTPALVVNRPTAMASNACKPYQALSAQAVGFAVPQTLLTTDPEAAREFAAVHGAVIYKSVGGTRSIVTSLHEEDMQALDDVRWCPTQFQARVPGTDVRVHVVSERVFALEIESEADDYRYGNMTRRPCRLPASVQKSCVALASRLGFELTGIDLRRTPDGHWYCFEANPAPAFAHFGEETAEAVASAVAEHLIAGRIAHPRAAPPPLPRVPRPLPAANVSEVA